YPEIAAYIALGRRRHRDQRPRAPGHSSLHPHEPVPAALVQPLEPAPPGQVEPPVHRDRVVDGRDQRYAEPSEAEHAVAEPLVVVHDIEVPGLARSARSARTLNVSGSGNAPPHIIATSS